ncbi:hypothetical protein pipiens_011777 [Culex pipiens pipiens]|uniref:Uncharacterized protein n=1 Tax=Culex pipiens pipiens TaxID=38569 RepID=A0ABD1D4X7_CULPP
MAAASVQQIPAAAATSQQQPLHNRLQLSTSLSASHSAGSHQSLLTTSPSANNQLGGGGGNVQTGIERLSRPMAFDKFN